MSFPPGHASNEIDADIRGLERSTLHNRKSCKSMSKLCDRFTYGRHDVLPFYNEVFHDVVRWNKSPLQLTDHRDAVPRAHRAVLMSTISVINW